MKRMSKYKLLSILFTVTIFIAACTKEKTEVRLEPKLSTSQVTNLTSDSANVVGFIVAAGSGFTERGICYDIQTGPTTASNKVEYTGTSTSATFSVKLRGITRLTKYYARAYAINTNGTIYGDEIIFNTPAALPTLAAISTSTLANTTNNKVTATTVINITDDGGPDVTANITKRGVVYGLYEHPTKDSSKTEEGTGKGQFTSLALNLKGNKTYYLRAYATNKIGTSYSNEISFTTPIAYATIKTDAPTKIGKTTATFNGVVTYNGGGTISERGFCYSLTANPTTADTKFIIAAGKDSITTDVSGLSTNTTYHVRAYVINQTGTNYGADQSFKTLANITKLWVVGSYNGWDNSDNAKYIISTITSAGAAEGYVYLTTDGIKLTSDHTWADAGTYGDDGSGKLTHGGNNIAIASAGYYLIKANLTDMSYSLTKTTWGVMGDYNGWASQTDMTYNSSSLTFSLALHLTSGGAFKFRGTSDWNINYGSTAADGTTLNAGGDNIPVTVTADYALTLDLSHPNEYTYSANRWGMIGDFNSWGGDVVMTWDATNHVFTGSFSAVAGGAFKFRANGAWTVNLGGNINALTPGGDNIAYATAGNYTVTLDPWSKIATVTKN